jgi:purine-binding chemotaxis protein CheW
MGASFEEAAIGTVTEQKLNKYLTFALGNEEYGLEILKVREIIGLMDITRVPRMPDFIRGVINLRGKIIPVIDLRLKFGMDELEDTKETCIIVVDLERLLIGVVVDQVSEVLDIVENKIEDTPDFGISVDTEFILGVGKCDENVVMILDIAKVLTTDDINRLLQSGGE